tara:strand:- start:239 stop:424 length:186 start_codon:yes stop_codon:yes gene_type:complete
MTVPSKVHADYFYNYLFYDFHYSVSSEKLVSPFTIIGFAYYDHFILNDGESVNIQVTCFGK